MEYVRYIDRTRDYYLSQGYEKPYQWAEHDEVALSRLKKPLSECKVGLLTTSELAIEFDEETEEDPIIEEGFRSVYAIPADTPTEKFYSRTSSFDSYATHLDDVNTFFPIDRLREAVASGRVAGMPDRLLGAYNNYSIKKVMNDEAPKALEMCRADGLDACVLVPV
jgi:hypothetical protein